MKTWHLYRMADGVFEGRTFASGSDDFIENNVPSGYGVREDVIDWQSQRVDVETGELIDYQPSAPDADHEWIHDDAKGRRVRRWVLKPEAAQKRAQAAAALSRIKQLESKQERAIRERLLGKELTDEDRANGAMTLEEIEAEISAQRALLNR